MSTNADAATANGGVRGRAQTAHNQQQQPNLDLSLSTYNFSTPTPAAANGADAFVHGSPAAVHGADSTVHGDLAAFHGAQASMNGGDYSYPDPPNFQFQFPDAANGGGAAADQLNYPVPASAAAANGGSRRANRRQGSTETIPPPYPWATDRRAHVHPLNTLQSQRIKTITGQVQCKKCEAKYDLPLDLESTFADVSTFLKENKHAMRDRAPQKWTNPTMPACKFCGQANSVKPVIAEKKKAINWLFLLLSQTLGFCTLEQLKYFCKHTKNHRTGAKDRVLYLTYLALCKQVDPEGPFDLR